MKTKKKKPCDEIESEEEMKYYYDGPNECESDEEIELPIESIRFPHFDKESEEGKKYSKNKKEYFEKKRKVTSRRKDYQRKMNFI